MKPYVRKTFSIVITLVVVIAAGFMLRHLWHYYLDAPWTRDAHIGADVVQIAPDVSGLVSEVRVQDNAQVHKGDVLFTIDQARYRIALAQAKAALAQSEASVAQLKRETGRDRAIKDLIAAEEIEARRSRLEQAQAAAETAKAAVDLAQLNLERTEIRSPVDGRVNDRTVRTGDYVTAGKPVLAVLDTQSFRVDGYFEETRLRHIRLGDAVDIHIMGEDGVLHGHVQSIAVGIQDRYRSDGADLLPNVTPAFDWVRLAQRVPVRISIDDGAPQDLFLIAGRSATVNVVSGHDDDSRQAPAASANRTPQP